MAKYCIGIDLGGTFIKFTLVDESYRASEVIQRATGSGSDEVVSNMVLGAETLLSQQSVNRRDVVAVGIGSPGPLNTAKGIILDSPNIKGMVNFPLRDRVCERLGLPGVLVNDANAAAYGEYLCGAGHHQGDMVLLTLGTGVGSGIVLGGKLLEGAHGIGGEMGHMVVHPGGEPCGCGQRGCLERYCSATFIAQRARRLLDRSRLTGLLAERLANQGEITAKDVEETAFAGDETASQIWQEAVYYLAIGCVNICRTFDPDRIVLGGGLTHAGARLMVPLLAEVEKLNWTLTEQKTRIEFAQLGNRAGSIGAAGVAWASVKA